MKLKKKWVSKKNETSSEKYANNLMVGAEKIIN